MTAVLWHIEVSHYNEKARWALDYKGVPHIRKAPRPGVHGAYALAITRGKQRRLPVLQLDGRAIGDSTAIIAALEEYRPDPPLYPTDPGDRARALQLEDFFDENLAPQLRAFTWHHTIDDAQAVADALAPNASPGRAKTIRRLVPAMRPAVRRDYGANEEKAAQAVEDMRAAMDRLEREVGPSGYLVGDSFTVADLTAASLFTPLVAPPQRPYLPRAVVPAVRELGEELSARDGGRWVFEMYARHRGESAEVQAA